MSTRLRFILDGDDHLSPVLLRAGDSSARLHRRLNDDMNGNSNAVRGFFQSADGRLRDLRGRFMSVADAQRMMAGGMPDLTRRLGDVSNAGNGATNSLGGSGGGLGGAMLGVAGIAAMSLLPALGALVPMMAGAGLALGTLKLGFAGVSDAMAVAGNKKEFAKQLKKMSPESREFTKSLVSLKKEFSGFGKEVQKAMLPGFTKAVQAAAPVVKILGKAMTGMGAAFGDAGEGVARMLRDSGFQDALQKNLQLGTGFIRDMTMAMGPFVRSLLDFGAASGPTLKAFSDGIGGMLSKGLPGFFQGLTPGIGGAAKMLDGLFGAINTLLPALGRLSGEMGKTLGPIFGEIFRTLGDVGAHALDTLTGALEVLAPILKDIGYGLKTANDIAQIIGPTMKDAGLAIAGAFLPVGGAVDGAVGPLQRLNGWVNNNKGAVLEAARIFGGAMIDMVSAAVQAVPPMIRAWKLMSVGALESISVAVHAGASMFGWVPGIGGKLKGAAKAFDKFKDGYIGGLNTAQRTAEQFAASTTPKLAAGKLKLNINNWQQQLETAKAKLKTVPPSKQSALKATIRDLEAKIGQAKRDLSSIDGRTATVRIMTQYFTAKSPSQLAAAHGRAHGGPAPRFAGGGMPSGLLRGAGTGMSDSIPMWWASTGEYVVNAKSTAKHRSLIEAINSDTLGSGSGGLGGAGLDVGKGLIKGMDASSAGVGTAAHRMAAAITVGIRDEMEIRSPSKKTKALAADIGKGLIVGLTGTQSKIKATAKDLAKDIWAAFTGSKDNRLVAMVNRDTKKLLSAAAKRDALASKIATAKKFATDITSAARENAGLSNLGMDADQVTAGGIKAGLASKLAQVKQFTHYVDVLAKRGLNKGLLRQILNMGPEAGYAYASALAGADTGTLKSINSVQSQLDKSTTSLGRLGADRMYDSGKNASKGFLAGLQSQEKALEKVMEKLAKSMQKSLRHALGIKSPATKVIPDGINTARGVAKGVLAGLPYVDQAMETMAGRMTGRAGTAVIGRPAVVAAGGGGAQINFTIQGAIDPYSTAREIEKLMNKYKRGRGGATYNFG
jgi:hypothetical protein